MFWRRSWRSSLFFSAGIGFFLVPGIAQANFLDTFLQQYQRLAQGWSAVLTGYAVSLFAVLAGVDFAWSATTWVIARSSLETLQANLIRKIFSIGGFYLLLIGASANSPFGLPWPQIVINSFVQAGQTASGGAATSALTTPGEIFTVGVQTASTLVTLGANLDVSLVDNIEFGLLGAAAAVVILLCYALITATLMVTLIESYLVTSAGLLLLGFGGSRFTSDFASKYFSYVIAVGVKLLTLYLITGAGETIAQNLVTQLQQINDTAQFFQAIATVVGDAFVFAYLVFAIPSLASAQLSGAPQLSAAGLVGTTAGLVAGGIGAGIVTRSAIQAADRFLSGPGSDGAGQTSATGAAAGAAGGSAGGNQGGARASMSTGGGQGGSTPPAGGTANGPGGASAGTPGRSTAGSNAKRSGLPRRAAPPLPPQGTAAGSRPRLDGESPDDLPEGEDE
jgi:type IV secretion system protein TrbL